MRLSIFVKVFAAALCWFLLPAVLQAAPSPNYAASKIQFLQTKETFNLTILGESLATKEQCLDYLLKRNPFPAITVSPKELVDYFYEEALKEGVRPDVVFAQALHETGNFRYGGDVVPLQNNYCGLGTTGGGVKGAWFPHAKIGIRAQIQHLLAYSTKRPPSTEIVDPRYDLVKNSNKFAQSVTWTDLNGKWAVPGKTYGQKILKIHQTIMTGN
ncbi:glucosaminidase domain-containing protein [Dendrosporobacter sp. 1207_IL3150]|uniref:glucosaminidase domain-containing protein n=1 Tax=Dendrosporobacter sp. 1207_IL3150 TaxID=3084054 RepID=UPI002FDA6EB8